MDLCNYDYKCPVNGAKSFYRGWDIIWINNSWVYADTKEPIPGWGGVIRPCKKCGAIMNDHEPDKCLGNLPGVDNACCGHGIDNLAYIRFTNGLAVEGFHKTHEVDILEDNNEIIKN
jgi:hypothetical protein